MRKSWCDINLNGDRRWYIARGSKKLHRHNGPAVVLWRGTHLEWWINGRPHRTDGPAVERPDGTRLWYYGGKEHRIDGPACVYADGRKFWYVDGIKYTDEFLYWLAANEWRNTYG